MEVLVSKKNLIHCSFNTKQRKCEIKKKKRHTGNQPFYILVLDESFKTKNPQT